MDKTKTISNVHVVPTLVNTEKLRLEAVPVYLIQTVQLERFNFENEINRLFQLRRVALWKAAQKLLSPNTAASQSLSPVCFASDYIRQ